MASSSSKSWQQEQQLAGQRRSRSLSERCQAAFRTGSKILTVNTELKVGHECGRPSRQNETKTRRRGDKLQPTSEWGGVLGGDGWRARHREEDEGVKEEVKG